VNTDYVEQVTYSVDSFFATFSVEVNRLCYFHAIGEHRWSWTIICWSLCFSYCRSCYFLRLSGGADIPLPIGCWFGYISNQMPGKCPNLTHTHTWQVRLRKKANPRHVNVPITTYDGVKKVLTYIFFKWDRAFASHKAPC